MTYHELQSKHQKEVNDFLSQNAFFAFSNEGFQAGLAKLHIELSTCSEKLIGIDGGGYVLKDKKDEMHAMFKRQHDELRQFQKDEKAFVESIVHELNNHEFRVTGDETEALIALDIYEDYIKDERTQRAVKKAIKICNDEET